MVKALRAFANEVARTGVNDITTKDLMDKGTFTWIQNGNKVHLRCHGFIQKLKEPSHWCLTKKGAAFLRGEVVEAIAIIDKKTHSNIGYAANENGCIYTTTLKDVLKSIEGWWDGWNYEIIDGKLTHLKKL